MSNLAVRNESLAATPDRGIRVRTLRSFEELEEIRSFWESSPGNRDSDPYFFPLVLRASRDSIRPHVVVVYRDGHPATLLVGRLECGPFERLRIGYIRIRPRVKSLYFVYGALRGNASTENCELLVREVCRSLAHGEADLAYLNYLREDSEIYRLAQKIPGTLSRDRVRNSQRHFAATLPRTLEELHKKLSPKVRKNQRWNKMNRDFPGAVHIKCFCKLEEVPDLAEVAEQVARHSYQRGLGVGFFDTEGERQRLQLKAEKGWLRGFVLYIGDQPAAFWIGDINEGIFGSEYLGFDPAFSKYSPGMYLVVKVIEGFCAGSEHIIGVDFATGTAEYKEALSDHVWDENSIGIFAPSFRGIMLNILKTFAVGVDNTIKGFLERTGLLQKIKRAWRRRLIDQQQSA